MKKSFWLVLGICCVLVSLVVVFIFSLPHLGMNNDFFNGKRPTDMGEALWCSKDGKSWFQVKDDNICVGELYYKEKIFPVFYIFEHFDRITVCSRDENEVYVSEDFFLNEEMTVFYGTCKFKKKKMSVEIHCEDDTEHIEKITFEKVSITQGTYNTGDV